MHVQVNLFQKLATSAEHVVYQNCSECQNKTKNNNLCTQHVFKVFWDYTFHEQSVVILWVYWCFLQIFTCTCLAHEVFCMLHWRLKCLGWVIFSCKSGQSSKFCPIFGIQGPLMVFYRNEAKNFFWKKGPKWRTQKSWVFQNARDLLSHDNRSL